MRLAILLSATLLLAGCAASKDGTTVTETKTITLLTSDGRMEERSPSLTFNKQSDPSKQGGRLTVIAVQGAPSDGLWWSDIRVRDLEGAPSCQVPTGEVEAGDVIVCQTDGPHSISYAPTGTLLYTAEF